MFRLLVSLFYGLSLVMCAAGILSTAVASENRKCIFELYQFRSPIISGCGLTYNDNGLTEVYTYIKKGQYGSAQVYSGQPGYGPQLGQKDVMVKGKCPNAVVREIDKMLKDSEVKSFEGAKNTINEYAKIFMQNEIRVGTVNFQQNGSEYQGVAALLGGSFPVTLKSEGAQDQFLYGALENGMTMKFRVAKKSTLTMEGDFGALDFRGGCD